MPTEVLEHETRTTQPCRANIIEMDYAEETCFYVDIKVISSYNLYGLTKEHPFKVMTQVEEVFRYEIK